MLHFLNTAERRMWKFPVRNTKLTEAYHMRLPLYHPSLTGRPPAWLIYKVCASHNSWLKSENIKAMGDTAVRLTKNLGSLWYSQLLSSMNLQNHVSSYLSWIFNISRPRDYKAFPLLIHYWFYQHDRYDRFWETCFGILSIVEKNTIMSMSKAFPMNVMYPRTKCTITCCYNNVVSISWDKCHCIFIFGNKMWFGWTLYRGGIKRRLYTSMIIQSYDQIKLDRVQYNPRTSEISSVVFGKLLCSPWFPVDLIHYTKLSINVPAGSQASCRGHTGAILYRPTLNIS